MGWVTRNENICFEAWRVPIVLLGDGIAAVGTSSGGNSIDTVQHNIKSPYEQVTDAIMTIIQVIEPNLIFSLLYILIICVATKIYTYIY